MKAPDKIYMHAKEVQSYQEPYGNWKIVYIRKDALLEWVKERLDKDVGIGLNAEEMGFENGKYRILKELEKKLNSM